MSEPKGDGVGSPHAAAGECKSFPKEAVDRSAVRSAWTVFKENKTAILLSLTLLTSAANLVAWVQTQAIAVCAENRLSEELELRKQELRDQKILAAEKDLPDQPKRLAALQTLFDLDRPRFEAWVRSEPYKALAGPIRLSKIKKFDKNTKQEATAAVEFVKEEIGDFDRLFTAIDQEFSIFRFDNGLTKTMDAFMELKKANAGSRPYPPERHVGVGASEKPQSKLKASGDYQSIYDISSLLDPDNLIRRARFFVAFLRDRSDTLETSYIERLQAGGRQLDRAQESIKRKGFSLESIALLTQAFNEANNTINEAKQDWANQRSSILSFITIIESQASINHTQKFYTKQDVDKAFKAVKIDSERCRAKKADDLYRNLDALYRVGILSAD